MAKFMPSVHKMYRIVFVLLCVSNTMRVSWLCVNGASVLVPSHAMQCRGGVVSRSLRVAFDHLRACKCLVWQQMRRHGHVGVLVSVPRG